MSLQQKVLSMFQEREMNAQNFLVAIHSESKETQKNIQHIFVDFCKNGVLKGSERNGIMYWKGEK